MSEDRSRDAREPRINTEGFEEQQETIAALREQLARANEWDRENRRIIAALTQRVPAIDPPPVDSAPGSPETATEDEGRSTGPAGKLGLAGLIFIYAGMGTLAIAVILASVILVREIYPDGAAECFSNYGLPVLLVIASAMFAGFGYFVLQTVSAARR